eukprot:2153614-Pyramimonas_sp.AAC.1
MPVPIVNARVVGVVVKAAVRSGPVCAAAVRTVFHAVRAARVAAGGEGDRHGRHRRPLLLHKLGHRRRLLLIGRLLPLPL